MPDKLPLDFELHAFLPYRLAFVAAKISRDFSAIYRERYGLSRAEWRILAHLSQASEVSVRDIHVKTDLEKSKVSRAASRLEAAGYLTKTANDADRRLVVMALTPKGWALMEEMAPLANEYERRVLEQLGPEAAGFLGGLETLSQGSDTNET